MRAMLDLKTDMQQNKKGLESPSKHVAKRIIDEVIFQQGVCVCVCVCVCVYVCVFSGEGAPFRISVCAIFLAVLGFNTRGVLAQPAGGRGRHFSAFKQPSRGGSGKGSGAGRAQSDGSTWGSGARPAAVAAVVHPQRKRVRFQDEAADDDSDFHSPPGGEFPTSL